MGKKRLLFTLLTLIFCAPLFACNGTGDSAGEYVVKINDDSISRGEFMIYLKEAALNFEEIGGSDIWETDFDGQAAASVAKDSALNALQTVVITAQNASAYHIRLTDSDYKQAEEEAKQAYEALGEEQAKHLGITLQNEIDVMLDKLIYSKVYEEISKSYVLSDSDFELYYKGKQEGLENAYTQYTYQSIFVKKRQVAEEVVQKAGTGEAFGELFAQYEEVPLVRKQGVRRETRYQWEMENMFGVAFHMEVGAISGALGADGGYYIIKIEGKKASAPDFVKQEARNSYITERKQQLFDDEYKKWAAEAQITRDEPAWNALEVPQEKIQQQ